jgi:hypothetical protein
MMWGWSGSQPGWIESDRVGYLWVKDKQVQYIGVSTRIPLGQIRLLFGQPQTAQVIGDANIMARRVLYSAQYADNNLDFTVFRNCPVKDIWRLPVYILVTKNSSRSPGLDWPSEMYRLC